MSSRREVIDYVPASEVAPAWAVLAAFLLVGALGVLLGAVAFQPAPVRCLLF